MVYSLTNSENKGISFIKALIREDIFIFLNECTENHVDRKYIYV